MKTSLQKRSNKSIFLNFYALAIFLSAFLVFQIQPIISKNLLPWFGGTSSVWTTSLMFYSTLLFVGYAYVYFLGKISTIKQIYIHSSLTVLSLIFVIYSIYQRDSLSIPLEWTSTTTLNPSVAVLSTLLLSVGLPYTLLCSTSPLFQHWFTKTNSKEPYKLYAISNVGSLLALLSYPFIFERMTTLKNQELIWSVFFVVFTIISLIISYRLSILTKVNEAKEEHPLKIKIKDYPITKWLLFSSIPTFMLVATTAEITQKITAIPLLWVIPLCAYLLSYIIAFTGIKINNTSLLLLACAIAASISSLLNNQGAVFTITSYVFLLFMLGFFFHSQLYASRPAKEKSSFFYLFTSLGGALGTLFASLIPPIIFNDIYEFRIGILITLIFLLFYIFQNYLSDKTTKVKNISMLSASISFIALLSFTLLFADNKGIIFQERDFYVVTKVKEQNNYRSMINNHVVQGNQHLDPDRQYELSPYFSLDNSALSSSFEHVRERAKNEKIDVAVLGLGAGELSSMCKGKDSYDYYEISETVAKSAKKYFTYLDKCEDTHVNIGDGRLLMQERLKDPKAKKYDLIILDAFNGDSAPTHLLTAEALKIYEKNLKDPNGIILLHISSNRLELRSVIASIAEKEGYSYLVYIVDDVNIIGNSEPAKWAILTRDKNLLNQKPFSSVKRNHDFRKVKPWTDEYTDILSILK